MKAMPFTLYRRNEEQNAMCDFPINSEVSGLLRILFAEGFLVACPFTDVSPLKALGRIWGVTAGSWEGGDA